MQTQLLTVSEVAKELKVCPQRVRALIHSQRLRATRIGTQFIINADDVDAVRVRKPGRPGWVTKTEVQHV